MPMGLHAIQSWLNRRSRRTETARSARSHCTATRRVALALGCQVGPHWSVGLMIVDCPAQPQQVRADAQVPGKAPSAAQPRWAFLMARITRVILRPRCPTARAGRHAGALGPQCGNRRNTGGGCGARRSSLRLMGLCGNPARDRWHSQRHLGHSCHRRIALLHRDRGSLRLQQPENLGLDHAHPWGAPALRRIVAVRRRLYGRWFGIFAGSLVAIGSLLDIRVLAFWSICVFALSVIVIYQLGKGPETEAREIR